MGISAFSELSLEAQSWKTAYWAQKNGLLNKVYENHRDMDEGIDILVCQLVKYNPEALLKMKQIFWEGTDHWDELLIERAELSGKMVLSDFTKEALNKFKNK
jgi:methylglutaconyl-CoA hydratase